MSPQLLNALRDYMRLTEEQDSLDNAPCSCDYYNFWTCENCHERAEVGQKVRSIEDVWGSRALLELAKREGITAESAVR